MDTQLIRLLRAGTLETNPTQFIQRTNPLTAAIARGAPATLLSRRDATGLRAAVLLDATAVAANATLHLTQAVGLCTEPVELPDVPALGRRRGGSTVQITHRGNDVRRFSAMQTHPEQPAPVGGKPWLA